MSFAHVFGPVASGRLGHSLGLDLLGKRICSMDCLYCEAGRTEILTCERMPYVPANVILTELAAWRDKHPSVCVDHITLGGMGEPTLNSHLANIIEGCKKTMPHTPVAVLTNSSLLHRQDVRHDLALANVVLPSLDTLLESEFRMLNRPAKRIILRKVAASLQAFRKEYRGQFFLEILLSQGINDSQENLDLLRQFVPALMPDRVDITTVSRPGAYEQAQPVSHNVRKTWHDILTTGLPDSQADQSMQHAPTDRLAGPTPWDDQVVEDMVQRTLARRPQTAEELARALQLPQHRIRHALEMLQQAGRVAPIPAKDLSPQHETCAPFFGLADR